MPSPSDVTSILSVAGVWNAMGGQPGTAIPFFSTSPFLNQSSIAFISSGGGYQKITVPDTVENHATSLYAFNNNLHVIGSGGDAPGDPVYTWNPAANNFDVIYNTALFGEFGS